MVNSSVLRGVATFACTLAALVAVAAPVGATGTNGDPPTTGNSTSKQTTGGSGAPAHTTAGTCSLYATSSSFGLRRQLLLNRGLYYTSLTVREMTEVGVLEFVEVHCSKDFRATSNRAVRLPLL